MIDHARDDICCHEHGDDVTGSGDHVSASGKSIERRGAIREGNRPQPLVEHEGAEHQRSRSHPQRVLVAETGTSGAE